MNIEEGRSIFAYAKTFVLWDSLDFYVDDDEYEIDSFYHNLISSLRNAGYYGGYPGDVCITAFGRRRRDSPQMTIESLHPKINQLGLRNRYARHHKILMDMIRNATDRRAKAANYMLIVKGMVENQDIEFVSVVKELKNSYSNCNLLLVVGDKDEDMSAYPSEVLSCFTTVWSWTGLVNGGPPIIPPPTTSEDEEDDEDEDEDQGSSPKRQCN